MRPELRTEMLRILEELTTGKEDGVQVHREGEGDRLKSKAADLLKEHGALEKVNDNYYRITISGYDYYQELKSPEIYWFKKNWFPLAVLALTALAMIVNVIVELID